MARKGWRLTGTSHLSYDFEPCKPGEYEYRVEFIAQMSRAESEKYRDFLEDCGYDVLYKNLNLDWTTGKLTWRPYGHGLGQFSTSPGTFNRELLIVGKKKDGKPFELHSTNADKAVYLRQLRNAWLSVAILLLGLSILKIVQEDLTLAALALGVSGIFCLLPAVRYQLKIHVCKEAAEIRED